jgi:aspartyl/glutamyl-tRNA(Asn/Gln) amidotransferase C subunit
MLKEKDVLAVAQLAHLKLSANEQKKYTTQLEGVLGLFEVLKNIDLGSVGETSQVTGLKNICQTDEVVANEDLRPQDGAKLVELSPKHNQNSIIVPKIIQN